MEVGWAGRQAQHGGIICVLQTHFRLSQETPNLFFSEKQIRDSHETSSLIFSQKKKKKTMKKKVKTVIYCCCDCILTANIGLFSAILFLSIVATNDIQDAC